MYGFRKLMSDYHIQVFYPCVKGTEAPPTGLLPKQRHSRAPGNDQVKSSLMNYKL